jgi:hypothetical protein
MSVFSEKFAGGSNLPPEVRGKMDRNFNASDEKSAFTPLLVRSFVDATAGAVTKTLPLGSRGLKDYYFCKTDASANAVSILPTSPDTLFVGRSGASTEFVLSNQGSYIWTHWSGGVWYIISYVA